MQCYASNILVFLTFNFLKNFNKYFYKLKKINNLYQIDLFIKFNIIKIYLNT